MLGSDNYPYRALSDVKYIAIHHSAVDIDNTALEIARYHVNVLGWQGIGYHFVSHWDGSVDFAGDIETARANVAKRNPEVIGICLPGDFTGHYPTRQQIAGTRSVIEWLKPQLNEDVQIVGHYEIALPGYGTACPGLTYQEWRKELMI